jgi:hypothetical protein
MILSRRCWSGVGRGVVSYLVWACEVRDRAIDKNRIIFIDIFFVVGFWIISKFFYKGEPIWDFWVKLELFDPIAKSNYQ